MRTVFLGHNYLRMAMITDSVSHTESVITDYECQDIIDLYEMNWNKWGFRPPLCTYMLNRARKTSWECSDEWDDTNLQTQDSEFEP